MKAVAASLLVLLSAATALAQLPAPTVPEGFGVHIHFTDPSPGEMERFGEGGFRFARMDLLWHQVEKTPGVYDFAAHDRLVAHLARSGARPLLVLDYGSDLHQKGAPVTREARKAFARFATETARHFKGKGVLFEIWNEPNLPQFWQPRVDADAYAALAIEAARAIHAADKAAIVMAPGCSGFDWPFLEGVFKAGLLEAVDAVSVHPYRGTAPETAATDWVRLRGMVARYAPEKKRMLPLVSSEWGYSTREGGLSEELQAAYLVRSWLTNLAGGVNLSLFYDWRDDGDDPKEAQHRFGIVRRDLTPKPSFLAAKGLVADLAGFTLRHRLAEQLGQEWRLLFQKGDTDEMAIVSWSADPAAPAEKQMPRIRRVETGNRAFTGLRRLAAVRFDAGARAEGLGSGAPLAVTVQNSETSKAEVALAVTTLGDPRGATARVSADPGKSRSQTIGLPIYIRRRAVRLFDLALTWNGERLPEIAPLPVARIDPLAVTAARRGEQLIATIENPSGEAVRGTIDVLIGGRSNQTPFEIPSGETSVAVEVKAPGDAVHRLVVFDLDGNELAETDPLRYEPLAGFDGPWNRVRFVEDAAQAPEPLALTDLTEKNAPARQALRFAYTFPAGWQSVVLAPPPAAAIPARATALTLWVRSDGSGNALRCRLADASGQTFQFDLGDLRGSGWRAVTIPLDAARAARSWGGAGDGAFHGALRWEALLLIDSADRKSPKSGEVLVAAPFYLVAP